mmetsp:Transcript_59399/g.150482  ORF Transcript_59399/g.150482 Transcript_59399/m.150482 type:complete len:259 (+) Transcript_59399:103-879(+)
MPWLGRGITCINLGSKLLQQFCGFLCEFGNGIFEKVWHRGMFLPYLVSTQQRLHNSLFSISCIGPGASRHLTASENCMQYSNLLFETVEYLDGFTCQRPPLHEFHKQHLCACDTAQQLQICIFSVQKTAHALFASLGDFFCRFQVNVVFIQRGIAERMPVCQRTEQGHHLFHSIQLKGIVERVFFDNTTFRVEIHSQIVACLPLVAVLFVLLPLGVCISETAEQMKGKQNKSWRYDRCNQNKIHEDGHDYQNGALGKS